MSLDMLAKNTVTSNHIVRTLLYLIHNKPLTLHFKCLAVP